MKVEDKHVIVQKFTENQLRAKQYKVKKTDVITVSSEPVQLKLNEDSDSDISDEDSTHPKHTLEIPTAADDIEPTIEILPEEENIVDCQEVVPLNTDVEEYNRDHVRNDGRPNRIRKPPKYLHDHYLRYED